MNRQEIIELLKDVHFEGYRFRVISEELKDGRECNFLDAFYTEADIHTGELSTLYTRQWLISPEATAGEIVQTAFKCLVTSHEHRVREGFTYKGERVLSPHFGLEFLVKHCKESKEYNTR